jgi:Beta-lactamase
MVRAHAREDLYDWDLATSRLAAQEPWWEPGTASGYHAITQGYLVGEVVRRVAGVSLGEYFAKELAPHGQASMRAATIARCSVARSRECPREFGSYCVPLPLRVADSSFASGASLGRTESRARIWIGS